MPLKMSPILALALALSIFLTDCGNGSSKSESSAGSVSGNWQMSLAPSNTNYPPTPQAGFIVDNGGTLSGSMLFDNPPCTGIGSVTGTVIGTNVSIWVSPVGLEINLTGTLGSDKTTMSGDYTILAAGCSVSTIAPQAGTWTANLVPPLNGNITGTFTSKARGTSFTVTGQVTQGASGGTISAPLTGTFSFPDFCVADVTVTGAISGTGIVLNLVNPDGTEAGQVDGTTSTGATSVTGQYNMVAQGSEGLQPCRGGDSGDVALAF